MLTSALENEMGQAPGWWTDAMSKAVVYESGVTFYAISDVMFQRSAAAGRKHTEHVEVKDIKVSATFEPATGGFPYALRAVGADGTHLWTTQVCAAGRALLGGLGSHAVELRVSGDNVVVWGAESHGLYVEKMRLADGATSSRFSSDLWMARQHPPPQIPKNRSVLQTSATLPKP